MAARPMLLTPGEKTWTPLARSVTSKLDQVRQDTGYGAVIFSGALAPCTSYAGADCACRHQLAGST
jgi:hypothetical protein